ncbi:hypothetical protein OG884_15685 [Streptosporangium sp. NBC_01755]|uniref:hypothetical protein n=1 Tax=Streptosporangium sp. NBC_01755 TaxID=2975949 RepID=UPI002DD86B90|nr:hypothetical protein [Streptosporangium sp. NBC_01755]WSD03275.1 hypothetical protein OG884_15685 [Streptosporangium sp. NBC_01755]
MTTDPRLKTITEALSTLIPGAVPDNLTVRVEEQLLAGRNSWDGTIDAVAARIHHALHGRPEQAKGHEPTTTPEQAAHVLHHFGATGGMEPGSFTQLLITTIASADRTNVLRLAAIYPGYVGACNLAQNHADGIRVLQGLARQMLVPAPQDGGDGRD